MLNKDYKFYLAFENSNCKEYITEKFFLNSLSNDILPIVMGARPADYAAVAPEHSYIHVDEFESPRELAEYLFVLDRNDDLYNTYFQWKGTGELVDTKLGCRLCALLHDTEIIEKHKKWYNSLDEWWRPSGICTNGSSWRYHQNHIDF